MDAVHETLVPTTQTVTIKVPRRYVRRRVEVYVCLAAARGRTTKGKAAMPPKRAGKFGERTAAGVSWDADVFNPLSQDELKVWGLE